MALVQPLAFGAGLQPVLIRRGTRDQGTKGTLRAPFASNNASFACYQGPRHGRNGRRGLSRAIGVGVEVWNEAGTEHALFPQHTAA